MADVRELRYRLEKRFGSNFSLEVGGGNFGIITVIDSSFEDLDSSARRKIIDDLAEDTDVEVGIAELYSPGEASERGVSLPQKPGSPSSWSDAIRFIDSGLKFPEGKRDRPFRRVVFYSYKGGVGRTTALIHSAFHLARQGKRVVLIDMDVEAPGLHRLLPPPDGTEVSEGLIDYLWERQVRPSVNEEDSAYELCLVTGAKSNRRGIAYLFEDRVSRGQVHVIPAGIPGPDYLHRLSTLSYEEVLSKADDAWSLFERELVEQLQPEIVLIDSRTGLSDWGGLSLVKLADEVFFVFFPSNQNIEGIKFVRRLLADMNGVNSHLVISPIPEGDVGKLLVDGALKQLGDLDSEEIVEITYSPGVSGATSLPVESAMPAYAGIASLIDDSALQSKVEFNLGRKNRWELIESLRFPDRDAKSIVAGEFEAIFQKTADFDKFLDDARWVIRGRKGTGKSTLFHLFVEHAENAARRAKGKLERIDIVAGHGPTPSAKLRPTTDEFGAVQRELSNGGYDWLSFWRAYALVRLRNTAHAYIATVLRQGQLKPLRDHLDKHFPDGNVDWRSTHTDALLRMVADPLNGLCRDAFRDINDRLSSLDKKLWILYDDLDQDIREEAPWQGEALGGLLRLAYDSNNQDIHNIRLKIFLREDIWSKLVFTNKSHFGEPRTVLLQWKIDDFLRLAYRLAVGGSSDFRSLAQREMPLSESEVDTATEEELQRALAPLWGLSQEKGKKALAAKWVYSRMTDARENTYPRSLTVLLGRAKEEELRLRSKTPPPDRLFSPRAMQEGLKAASTERCDALKNEYPPISAFLEDVKRNSSLRSQFTEDELKLVWGKTSKQQFPTFDSFVSQLEESGLLVRKRSATYNYGFASLYIDGLGVTRVQGEKK